MSVHGPRGNGTPSLLSPDSLTRAIVGVIVALALLDIGGVLGFGSILGPRASVSVEQLEWIAPTSATFVILSSFAIAFLCMGRYRAVGGAWAFWAGAVFLANAILNVFYLLAWPGLRGTGGVIAELPGTSAWLVAMAFTGLTLLMAAVNARQPERFEPAYAFAAYAMAAVAATLIGSLSVVFENALPAIIDGHRSTPFFAAWTAVLVALTAIAASAAYRQYAAGQDAMLGYLTLFLAMQVFALLDAILGSTRYDFWWYAYRFITALAYVPLLFGFLQEGYALFSHERERVEEREQLLGQVGRLADEAERRAAELDAIINSTMTGILVYYLDGMIVRANPDAERVLGYPESVLQRMSKDERVAAFQYETPEGRPLPIGKVPSTRALQVETVHEFLMVVHRADSHRVWLSASAAPFSSRDGRLLGAVEAFTNITPPREAQERARWQTERAQRHAQELEAIMAAVGDGLVVFGPQREIIRANKRAEQILGMPAAKWNQLTPDEREEAPQAQTPEGQRIPSEQLPLYRALRGETVIGYHMRLQRSDGRTVHVLTSTTPIRDARGTIYGAVAIYADITALHRLQEEREDFIRTISHDLKNPLTPVLGMAQWLERSLGKKGMEAEARSAHNIARSAQRMNSMITDLVDATRLETGKIELHQEPVDLFSFLSDLLTRVGTLEDHARIHLEEPEWVPLVLGDQAQLERVIANLLTNAFKYSSPGTPVVVGLQQAGGEARISVSDQGPGIPVEEQAYLFERYYRARSGLKTEGLGLGLYIARLIVETHGGRIWVESEVGKGSTFYVSLPLPDGSSER